ncbi:hypothetical protein RLO149_c013830 [Roseobacter litoralis Och 149]|uniref:Uncharacterized protein n=1 Tax=Roseobacter litoralis (strain ATCC 49566 / DSM 6996 / JCM 21268 / NBRC 15278 / OCh 149) TaxID=391595 RepID=F7ZE61_ROSLO|nr:hypothetical protein RLO149_c013830 [Roseobacter litoralis Och 149]
MIREVWARCQTWVCTAMVLNCAMALADRWALIGRLSLFEQSIITERVLMDATFSALSFIAGRRSAA